MEYVIAVLIIASIAGYAWMARVRAARERERRELFIWEARQFMADVKERRALRAVESHVILKEGESAFYEESSSLYETRAVRHYQSGYSGFRVAKGLYVGGSSGKSVSTQEWTQIATGKLTVTNKRMIFEGEGASRSVLLSKVLSVEPILGYTVVAVENRQKNMVFEAENSFIRQTFGP